MPELVPPFHGSCRCDAVSLEVTSKPLITIVCHCTGCQKMTASAFSWIAGIPKNALTVTGGETVVGGLKGAPRHHFCASCLSWIFTEPPRVTDRVNVRVTSFEAFKTLMPYAEFWTREKVGWVDTPAAHSFAAAPTLDELNAMMLDSPAWAAAQNT